MLRCLHIIKQFADGKFGPEDGPTWKNIWESLELKPWIERAQESLISLKVKANRVELPKYQKMQIDFIAFIYRMVNTGAIDPDYLCNTFFDDKPEYISVYMNNQALMYEMVNKTGVENNCIVSRMQLTGQVWSQPSVTDSIAVVNKQILLFMYENK